MLNSKCQTIYPPSNDNKTLANEFLNFFKTKIEKISATFNNANENQTPDPQCTARFETFKPFTPDEIRRYILSAPCKSSILDGLPTVLLKSYVEEVLPTITRMVNHWRSTRFRVGTHFYSHYTWLR